TVWVSHPWLGDGITEVDPYFRVNTALLELTDSAQHYNIYSENEESGELPVVHERPKDFSVANSGSRSVSSSLDLARSQNNLSRESLGLLLSCQLAELHGGEISIQGSLESGYRYVLSLPLHLGTVDTVSDV
ncbi:MAG: histidine kinase, partial [Rhizonema sp. PD38]|nr:histidine kinase [Rhizonema sp. PD38]